MTRRIVLAGAAAALASIVAAAPAAAAPIVTVETPALGCCTPDTRPVVTGTASTAPGTSQVTVQIFQGTVVDDSPEVSLLVTPAANGRYEATPNVALADGTWTVRASQGDPLGVGTSEPYAFVVDTVKPAPALTGPPDGTVLASNVVTIAGKGGTAPGDNASVMLFLRAPSGDLTLPAAVGPDGTFSVQTPALADGNHGVAVAQNDVAGNGFSSAEIGFTIDTKAPDTTIESGPVPVAGDSRTVQVDFGASELATYRCELDGRPIPDCEPPVLILRDLKKGRHELVITAVDPAGTPDPTPARLAFRVDLAAPKATVVAPAVLPTRGGETRVALNCSKGKAAGPCVGQIVVQRAGRSLLVKPARFSVAAGRKAQIKLFLNGRGQNLLFKNGRVRVQLVMVAADGRGNVGRRILRRTLVLGG